MPGLRCFVGSWRERKVLDWRWERGEYLFSWSGLWDFWKRGMVVVLLLLGVDEVLDFVIGDEFERV